MKSAALLTLFFGIFYFKLTVAQKIAPPGTTLLTKSVYIDKGPISNIDYVEFLWSIEGFWSPEFSDSIQKLPSFGIDSAQLNIAKGSSWILKNKAFIDKMQIPKTKYKNIDTVTTLKEYLAVSKIINLPVIGITYEQAKTFCKWRSDMVKILYAVYSKDSIERKKYYASINYRLPDAKEYEAAFNKFGKVRRKLNYYKGKEAFPYNIEIASDNIFIVYKNLISELLLSKGTLFKITSKKTFLVQKQLNDNSTAEKIGFRCVCEVTK